MADEPKQRYAYMIVQAPVEAIAWAHLLGWLCGYSVMYAKPRLFFYRPEA